MKYSMFNYYIVKNETVYVFNTRNGLMCDLPLDFHYAILNNDDLDIKTSKELKNSGFLVKSDFDELKDLETEYIKNKSDKNEASITVAPSLKCNFDCVYCYEKKTKEVIDEKKLDVLLDFIENNILKNTESLFFSWFGGEPSLCQNIMIDFTNKLISSCKQYNVTYKIMVISNGYILNKKLLDFYKKIANFEICITIDGFKDEHNKRRYLVSGKPTFDIIVKNIKTLLDNNVNTTLRINIDKDNNNDPIKLINYLREKACLPNRIYLGHIQKYTSSCGEDNSCLTKLEFSITENKINNYLYKNKLRNSSLSYEGPKKTFCKVNCKNSYVIDPNLNLYQCENDIGRQELAIGNIDNGDLQSGNNRFNGWSPFNFKKCKKCPLLPSCLGGCAFTSSQYGEPQCPAFKYNIRKDLNKMINKFNKKIE